MPKVSVIIPNLNNELYLRRSIESAQKQTLDDIEIIIIDDGSTDNSWEIIQELASTDTRIKAFRNPKNIGTGPSRNIGLDNATGEYIKFLDADDTMDKDVLEYMYTQAKKHDIQIVCGYMRYVDPEGKIQCKDIPDEILRASHNKIFTPEPTIENFVFQQIGIGDGLYKTTLFDNIRFPNLKWEDLATIPILKFKAGRILFVNKAVYNYTDNPHSTTSTDRIKKTPRIGDIIDCCDILRRNINPKYSDMIDFFELRHVIVRMLAILSWDDCSEENKARLISALNRITQIDIPNFYNNPLFSDQKILSIRQMSQEYQSSNPSDMESLIQNIGNFRDEVRYLQPIKDDGKNYYYPKIIKWYQNFVRSYVSITQ